MGTTSSRRLSSRVLRAVLSVYFVVVLSQTAVYFFVQYANVENDIRKDLAGVEDVFTGAMSTALWALSYPQVEALANSINKLPSVTGIEIVNADSGVQITHLPVGKSDISHQFQLNYTFENQSVYLATVTIYSNSSVIIERVKVGLFLLVVQFMILSVILTILFIWIINRYLKSPLEKFSCDVKQFSTFTEKEDQFYLDLKSKYSELDPLVNVLNTMGNTISQQFQSLNEIINSYKINEERLETAQEIARLGDWDWNLITGDVYWSKAIYPIFGLDPKNTSPSYERFLKLVHPDDRNDVVASIDNALYKDKPFNINHRVVLPDGTVKNVHEQGVVTYDNKREPVRMLGFVQDISIPQEILQKLSESEAHFKSIFDNSLYGIATTLGTDFRFFRVNDAFCRLMEYDRDELVGVRSIADVTLPEDYSGKNKPLLERLVKNEIQRFQIEKQYVTKSGRCIDTIVYVTGFYDNDGEYIGSTGSVMDITERKIMEKKLRNSEKKYRVLADNALVGVFTSTVDGRFTYVNDTMVRMFDYDGSERMMTDGPRVLWSDPGQRDDLINSLKKYGSATNVEALAVTSNDQYIYTLFSVNLIGDIIYGMVVDITERKQIEEKLQASESNLAKAQEVAHIGSWNLDLSSNNLVWTDENYKIFEISIGTPMTYEKFLERVHPDDREHVDKKWTAAIANKQPYDIEHRLLIGEEIKWVQEKAALTYDDEGNPVSGIGTTHEITRRKLAEIDLHESLTETQELLEKLRESENLLLQNQQDLQNLAGRLISIQEEERRRLARELHDDLAQRMALMAIEVSKLNAAKHNSEVSALAQILTDKLISLSEDIHRISRQLHPSIIEDLGLLEALKSEINNFSKLEEIPVKLKAETGLVNPSIEKSVALFRIAQESLRNIKKHAHANNVIIQLDQEEDFLFLTIKDNGRGFVPNQVRNKPGLGLKSMRERIRLLGGTISYNTQRGQGTTVEARIDILS